MDRRTLHKRAFRKVRADGHRERREQLLYGIRGIGFDHLVARHRDADVVPQLAERLWQRARHIREPAYLGEWRHFGRNE